MKKEERLELENFSLKRLDLRNAFQMPSNEQSKNNL